MLKKIKRALFKKSGNANKLAGKEQLKHAVILIGVLILCYGFYCYSSAKPKETIKQEEAHFDGVFGSEFNKDSDEALIEQQQHQIDSIKELMSVQEQKQHEVIKLPEQHDENKALIATMQEQLEHLEQENKKTKEQLQVALLSTRQASLSGTIRPPTREEIQAKQRQKKQVERDLMMHSGLETVQFKSRQKTNKEIRTAKNYVWAGTFAEGVLLTGILGDAGINGSKNMGTALIRLTSRGIMPNDKQSHLEDCVALVSTYGDLSGSSVVLHLETLSCAGSDINFEQKVYGSVFDIDAMQDLRGTSVLKTKPLLGYSAAAGMLAGFGDGLKNLNSAQSINPGTGTITTYGTATSLGQSAAGGAVSNPANRIADYVMRIADIYHPLVVARAGRKVSVLFTKGFWIDKEHQVYESGKSIDETRNESERGVTTTVSRAYDVTNPALPEGGSSYAPNPNQPVLGQNNVRLEDKFLSAQGQNSSDMFSPVQNKEPAHE